MSPSELPDLPYPLVRIHVLGRAVEVPEGLTLMKAMEYAGFRLVHGVGCRGGFCGSCGILYRMADDYKLRPALACQTTVAEGMQLAAMPFVPTNRARHDLTRVDLGATTTLLASRYPELARCVACNTCTKACPQELQVMDYVQLALRDDWAGHETLRREMWDKLVLYGNDDEAADALARALQGEQDVSQANAALNALNAALEDRVQARTAEVERLEAEGLLRLSLRALAQGDLVRARLWARQARARGLEDPRMP